MQRGGFAAVVGLTLAAPLAVVGVGAATEDPASSGPKPVASTGSGLLLQPPVDLSKFTRRDFDAASATVGAGRIGRPWTAAVTPLPATPGPADHALTEAEVERAMLAMRDHFDAGRSAPVSDAGLISTQEDVVRKPMLNHVAAFAGPGLDGFLLVQRELDAPHWGYFATVRDRSAEPPVDYFAEITGPRVKFEGATCYRCHSSGPLALHPAREDLVSDAPLLAAINRRIADQPPARFHFPAADPAGAYGEPLRLEACARCHDPDSTRGALFRVQSHPIRVLVDFGYMPPKHPLKPGELAELKAWLDAKP